MDDTDLDGGAQLAQHLSDIARVLLSPRTVAETLWRIAVLSVESLDGCDEASLCQVAAPMQETATSSVVAELDRLQTSLDEGPCVDILAGQSSVYVEDMATSGTWPRFGPLAVAAGMRSALAYRLFSDTETLGALQMYAHAPAAFEATERAQALIFAAHAGMALSVAQQQAHERGRAEHLRTAMLSREIIAQAQGILMERERITADQAFDLLRGSSQHLNRKLRDVAQQLVDTGIVPDMAPGDKRPARRQPPTAR